MIPDNSPETRRTLIGGSNAAAACGLSPYTTPLELWLFYIGKLPAVSESEPMRWGTLLEPAIVTEFSRRSGLPVSGFQRRIVHREHKWMVATVDALVGAAPESCDEFAFTVHTEHVQAKTTNERAAAEWGPEGSDDVPEHVLIQCQHEMAVVGTKTVHVPLLVAGQELRCYRIERNDRLIAAIVDREKTFWRLVQDRKAPEPDWDQKGTAALVEAMYEPQPGLSVDLGPEALAMAATYDDASNEAKKWDGIKRDARARLVEMMGEASMASLPDGRTIERKEVSRKGYEVAATSYVDFRIKTPRKVKVKS